MYNLFNSTIMRRTLSLAVILLFTVLHTLSGQTYEMNLKATLKKNYAKLKKGSQLTIDGLQHAIAFKSDYLVTTNSFNEPGKHEDKYTLLIGDNSYECKDDLADYFEFEPATIQDYWDAQILTKVLGTLQKKGTQYELRRELENECLDYISRIEGSSLEINDPYLENYLYSIIAKVAPEVIIDGRPGTISLLLTNDSRENASMLPNGTLIISSGLLSCLHSEDELIAILAHEIAHFMLDHHVQNINAAAARQKRAEFWAGLTTAITAAADASIAANNRYYMPGNLTKNMAIFSYSIASEILPRLGTFYNHEQEDQADKAAMQILELLGCDKNALATALFRLQRNMIEERNHSFYFASYTHPALMKRIQAAGKPADITQTDYERMVAKAVTYTAVIKYRNKRYKETMKLLDQNIRNGVASYDDYILQSRCLLYLKNDAQSNHLALEYVEKAKRISPSIINIQKSEILVRLRLKQVDTALKLLEDYIGRVQNYYDENREFADARDYANTEIPWARDMISRLRGQ